MDEKTIHEAVENISIIKGVIDKTSKSFTAFSKIFIYWGLLFILNSLINLIMIINKEHMLNITQNFPLLNYIFPVGVITLFAVIIYFIVSKNVPLVGLEKHLMTVWVLTLAMNVIPPKIFIDTANTSVNLGSITVHTDNLSTLLFSLSIASIITALLTDYKQLSRIGIVYIVISILHAYFNFPRFSSPLTQLLYMVSLPFTFLYIGFFLKTRQKKEVRGN
ncbi:MAG TPA: hypothetical protein GXX20_02930 [Clostridiaceae bacterium]|nr:hypothetical protein [Clostridiaceae bacterium]